MGLQSLLFHPSRHSTNNSQLRCHHASSSNTKHLSHSHYHETAASTSTMALVDQADSHNHSHLRLLHHHGAPPWPFAAKQIQQQVSCQPPDYRCRDLYHFRQGSRSVETQRRCCTIPVTATTSSSSTP